jgi:hypothetical protein
MSPTLNNAKEAEIRAEVEKLRSLPKDDLRIRWSKLFRKVPPPALTKDLLGRPIRTAGECSTRIRRARIFSASWA